MNRKPVCWADLLRRIFNPPHKRRPTAASILRLESLDDRIVPTTVFNASILTDGLTFDSTTKSGTLRGCIAAANASSDANVVINLTSLGLYNLTISNQNPITTTTQQENANKLGDLDIFDSGRVPGVKTYTIVGNGATVTQTVADRVFQIIGNDVAVNFQNLTITGGFAVDDGTAVKPFSTLSKGGGILNTNGANLSFSNVVVSNCVARGGDGPNGAVGSPGGDGIAAFGGGLYSTGGTLTLTNTQFISDTAIGGKGGNGGAGANKFGGSGGAGGRGGDASGGGIYAVAGSISLDANSGFNQNAAKGGAGGAGGAGGTATPSGLTGGAGGNGGDGGHAHYGGIFLGSGNVSLNGLSAVEGNGATGGAGGVGGAGNKGAGGGFGGAGGNGGRAGDATVGGIFAGSGNVTVNDHSSVSNNAALGGVGGAGGIGGDGNSNTKQPAAGGGKGGNAGDGGNAKVGGIEADTGVVKVDNNSSVDKNRAVGGAGGAGANGGVGGNGGLPGTSSGRGGDAGDGGVGGSAQVGGVYVGNGSFTVDHTSSVSSNLAKGAVGGSAGVGGVGGNGTGSNVTGGRGGDGGDAHAGGDATGGGIYVAVGNVTVDNGSSVTSNIASAAEGGNGGKGGVGGNGNPPTKTGSGGTGGDGGHGGDAGTAKGGGIFAQLGNVVVSAGSSITGNAAKALGDPNLGNGGDGGFGGLPGRGNTRGLTGFGEDAGNAGDALGGGIYAAAGNVTITGASHIDQNAADASATKGNHGGNGRGATSNATNGSSVLLGNGDGGQGGSAFGGGIYALLGNVTIDQTSTVNTNMARGGAGGSGGAAQVSATGGHAGAGGVGQGGGIWASNGIVTLGSDVQITHNTAEGGHGGAGGVGTLAFWGNPAGSVRGVFFTGANGADGEAGGSAQGGGVWVQTGNVVITGTVTVDNNAVLGGTAGSGGHGAEGVFSGGNGGHGGRGGDALGAGLYVGGATVTVSGKVEFNSGRALAGAGADGGPGGSGAFGNGTGGGGGDGGTGAGGGVYAAAGNVSLTGVTIDGNKVLGGHAGRGGTGGTRGTLAAGLHGVGGKGGDGGDALGGGLYAGSGNVVLNAVNIAHNVLGGTGIERADGGVGGSAPLGTAGNGGNGGDVLGGGVFVSGSSASLTIRNSSVFENGLTAQVPVAGNGGAGGVGNQTGGIPGNGGNGGNVQGGGIYTLATKTLISNSTISGNFAGVAGAAGAAGVRGPKSGPGGGALGAAGVSRGGGVFTSIGTTKIHNTTVVENQSADEGGGIRNQGALELVSSIVGRNDTISGFNDAVIGPDISDAGVINIASDNLIETTSGHTILNGANGNKVGVAFLNGTTNVVYSPIQKANNGTFFHSLVKDSPALESGSNPDNLTTDQVGNPRVNGSQTDIGSIEGVAGGGTPPGGGTSTGAFTVVSTKNGTVRIIDPNTGNLVQSWRPFDTAASKYNGVLSVAVGDINHDGVADIIVATRGNRAGKIKVFDGASAFTLGVDFSNSSTWHNLPNGLTNPLFARVTPFKGFKGAILVASGDVNGDGTDDLVAGTGKGTTGTVAVFSGPGLAPLGSTFTPFGVSYTGGVYVSVGDVDGDKKADVVAGAATGLGQVKVFQKNGSSYTQLGTTLIPFGTSPLQIAAVDTNGDGKSEIAVGSLSSTGTLQVKVFDGGGTQKASFTAATGVSTFGLSRIDLSQTGSDELQVAIIPKVPGSSGNQVHVLDPLTGTQVKGFDAFASLTGGVAIDGN